MDILSKSTSSVANSIDATLADQTRIERIRHLEFLAENDGTILLSAECDDLVTATNLSSPALCRIREAQDKSIPEPVMEAQAVRRKVAGLRTYVDTLALIASSQSETDILAGYQALQAATGDLAKATESKGIAEFAKRMADRRASVSTITRFAVENLRMRMLRKLVTQYDGAVSQVVAEARAILFKLNVDPKYTSLYAKMKEASDAVKQADAKDDKAAFVQSALALEKAQKEFTDYVPSSIYAKLSDIAFAHSALKGRLSRNASPEEVLKFIEAIKAVADSLNALN
jgi:hypothetical protein